MALVPLRDEAARRYEAGEISEEEYYPHESQMDGIQFRMPDDSDPRFQNGKQES